MCANARDPCAGHFVEQANEPPNKKQRLEAYYITSTGPLPHDAVAVPVDTIDAFRHIKEGFSRREAVGHPLFFLHGPRQFGKTTIAYRIADWIDSDSDVADIKLVFFEMQMSDVATEQTFWRQLGRSIDENSLCYDFDSVSTLVDNCMAHEKKQLCLVVDKMDCLFSNKNLAANFLSALRKWKVAASFRGFLGIGSHELIRLHEVFCGEANTPPFNVGEMIRVEPFSSDQMSGFFELIKPRYAFSASLQRGIMHYSSGAPGVFGSLVRFTVDCQKWTLEWDQWEPWFKLEAFSVYLITYNNTYHHIQGSLRGLTGLEWEALKYVLEGERRFTASNVEGRCRIPVRSNHERRLVDPLARMGVVIQGNCGELAIVSEMMFHVCVEALLVREIPQAAGSDDPQSLLSFAFRNVNPKTISNHLRGNRRVTIKSVMYLELYSTIRDILRQGWLVGGIHARAETPGGRNRADILVLGNRVRIAYDLTSTQFRRSELETAVQQADDYRQQSMSIRCFLSTSSQSDTS